MGHLSRKQDVKPVTAASTERLRLRKDFLDFLDFLDSAPSVLILPLHVASTTTLHGATVKNRKKYNNNNITVLLSHCSNASVCFWEIFLL